MCCGLGLAGECLADQLGHGRECQEYCVRAIRG
jgi:hypothetical protein